MHMQKVFRAIGLCRTRRFRAADFHVGVRARRSCGHPRHASL